MEEKLLIIARKVLEIDTIELSTPRAACEEWDSAVHLILLSELEEELDIEIPIEEVASIGCLQDFLKFVKE